MAPSSPSEKAIIGAQRAQAFLGPKVLNRIQQSARSDLPTEVSSQYIAEVCFSGYANEALTFRERSILNMGMMIALNRTPELRIHIGAALHNGLSQEEVVEVCRHAMVYCGVPAGREALSVASDIFATAQEAHI